MKVCVLTYIFGDYEILREVNYLDEDFEYVCVTDNQNLTSNTWKVVQYKEDMAQSAWCKTLNVRYSPFNYTDAEIVITLDGSMQINKSLKKLIQDFSFGNYDIGTIVHPFYSNIKLEIYETLRGGRYDKNNVNRTFWFFNNLRYDFNYRGYYMAGLMIRKNNEHTQIFNNLIKLNIEYISSFKGGLERTDQFQLSYVLNTYYNFFKVMPLSLQCVRNDIITQYVHGSATEVFNNVKYNINVPEYVYCQNKRVQSYFLKKGND